MLADKHNSISRDNHSFQRVVGKLQRAFKRADMNVFNGALPAEKQSDWSMGLAAIDHSVVELNNPYVDTIVIVDGASNSEIVAGHEQTSVQLRFQLYDLATKKVLQVVSKESVPPGDIGCDADCTFSRVNQELVRLGDLLSSKAVASVEAEYGRPANSVVAKL